MKARELRIGNLVRIKNRLLPETDGEIYKVSGFNLRFDSIFPESTGTVSLDHIKSLKIYHQFDEFIEPLRITKEWLFKFGFIKNDIIEDNTWLNLRYRYFTFSSDESVDFSKVFLTINKMDIVCEYVHQLQNLYFALTGTELTFKSEI